MATAIAPAATVATMENVDVAAAATGPAPKKWSKRQMEGAMIRNIKVDFDQSAELSDLISRHMDQQRWAFNMAVREKINDPRTTKFDLNKMLTKWRNEKEWMKGGVLVQRAGLLQGLDAVKKFMKSNGKKRADKSLWKYLARGRCPFPQTPSYLRQSWPCHVARDSCGLTVPSRIPIAGEPGSGLTVVARRSVRWGRGMRPAHAV